MIPSSWKRHHRRLSCSFCATIYLLTNQDRPHKVYIFWKLWAFYIHFHKDKFHLTCWNYVQNALSFKKMCTLLGLSSQVIKLQYKVDKHLVRCRFCGEGIICNLLPNCECRLVGEKTESGEVLWYRKWCLPLWNVIKYVHSCYNVLCTL